MLWNIEGHGLTHQLWLVSLKSWRTSKLNLRQATASLWNEIELCRGNSEEGHHHLGTSSPTLLMGYKISRHHSMARSSSSVTRQHQRQHTCDLVWAQCVVMRTLKHARKIQKRVVFLFKKAVTYRAVRRCIWVSSGEEGWEEFQFSHLSLFLLSPIFIIFIFIIFKFTDIIRNLWIGGNQPGGAYSYTRNKCRRASFFFLSKIQTTSELSHERFWLVGTSFI